jgi:hypothetical protein
LTIDDRRESVLDASQTAPVVRPVLDVVSAIHDTLGDTEALQTLLDGLHHSGIPRQVVQTPARVGLRRARVSRGDPLS